MANAPICELKRSLKKSVEEPDFEPNITSKRFEKKKEIAELRGSDDPNDVAIINGFLSN